MLPRPVGHIEAAAEIEREFGRDPAGGIDVADGEPDTARPPVGGEEPRGIVQIHERQAAVVLVHAGFEHSGHREAAHARKDAGRRDPALREQQHDGIADADIEIVGQHAADQHVEAAGFKRLDAALAQDIGQGRDLGFEPWLDPPHAHPGRGLARDDHALPFDERGRSHDILARERPVANCRPVVERPFEARDRRVRNHAENPLLQLVLETVHHRKHDD